MFISSNMRGDIFLSNVFFASGRKNLQFDGFNFRSANRLRVDKVRPAGCFSVLPLLTKTKTLEN